MSNRFVLFFVLLAALQAGAQRSYTALVNPFIGTGGHGHTYPGASMPFGMMQLSPDTRMADWDGSSGYHYSDSVIYGFSHTHLSGTGIPDYCDVLLMPFTGNVAWKSTEYRSPFSHSDEKAAPGYYEVLLRKHEIRARLTTSVRSGIHHYTFPKGTTEGSVLIDLIHRDEVLDAHLEKISDHEIRGYRRSKSWAENQHLYFYIRFDEPITGFVINNNGREESVAAATGKAVQAAVRLRTMGGAVTCRVGISGVSMDGARANLEAEIGGKPFDAVQKSADAAWNDKLRKIDIAGGTHDQQVTFYTALYHTYLAPNTWQDVDGNFRGTDGRIHKAEGFINHSVFSLWDTYRALHPLMTILEPARTNDWINTFLAQYKYGGMLPVWELSGNETYCMIGYHSASVITDAWQKGIRGFDGKLALQAMRSYAESDRFGLRHYRGGGYIANDLEHESVSKTLEYAYDDWCIAQFARMNGDSGAFRTYIQRAQYYKNLFDPATGFFRGKVGARWHRPFDPAEINNFYTEGNAWQYSLAVPHDIEGLKALHGGSRFGNHLDALFRASTVTTGREQPDVTGLIGQYAHGNEPSHHVAYLYNYVGAPYRTQELVHRICTDFYRNAPDGLIGNEDCGQMSAWYVFSALGFYPVCPGNGAYVLGTPIFDSIDVHLDNGKLFKVRAPRKDTASFYVNHVRRNGRRSLQSWIPHQFVAEGGELFFGLQPHPARFGVSGTNRPASAIREHLIRPVPFVTNERNKFRDSVAVELQGLDSTGGWMVQVQYAPRRDGSFGPGSRSFPYKGRFTIDTSAVIDIYSFRSAKPDGQPAPYFVSRQPFFRLPDNRSITVQSAVHPMYTAGGPDALVDGIMGGPNWRSGEWQSYFAKDFEAVVDLRESKDIRFLGVHVLQEVSPWILYPKDVQFWVSDDGVRFREAIRVPNAVPGTAEGAQEQELGASVQLRARYVKVRATSGGTLPAGHPSAGNPSHLFIDEVIIR
ncbi:MAG: glycoside hydrolase family 92 protein [Chitinophagaceae bacterium]|nr:MAG: glycoside hydrolase family 92 protein [Chitinophagaceae bacterium]